METKITSIRIPRQMIERLRKESDSLGISLSQLIIEILDAQLRCKKFSCSDYRIKNNLKRRG